MLVNSGFPIAGLAVQKSIWHQIVPSLWWEWFSRYGTHQTSETWLAGNSWQIWIKEIYNMDETGLLYRMQVVYLRLTDAILILNTYIWMYYRLIICSQAYNWKGESKARNGSQPFVCCNGNGTEKLPLWILGRFLNPRCFKNINRDNLGCIYHANTKDWMTFIILLNVSSGLLAKWLAEVYCCRWTTVLRISRSMTCHH